MTAPNSPPPAAAGELRKLPKADRLLEAADRAGLVRRLGHGAVMEAIRGDLERIRAEIQAGGSCPPAEGIERGVLARLEAASKGSLRPVINATGVVVHTNLGRAPLSGAAIEAMRVAAAGYTNLEFDLAQGERGDRYGHAEAALCRLTGAESAVVVNNNAAAVMLALAALMQSRPSGDAPVDGTPEVIVSRGQLVEIGGGFRIPDVLRRSGAALVEVGTTNRTYRRDFEDAAGPRTRILMSVHRSNFRLEGFVHDASLEDLVSLARERDLWVVDDLGSGTLLETAPFGLGVEPTVQERVRAGADLVCFSGDKLLGGPQAGILVGRREAIRRVKRHPLLRALRVDKVTLAGLSATLAHYERGEAVAEVPVWRAISAAPEALRARAEGWLAALGAADVRCAVVESTSAIGGGSLPEVTLPTFVLALPGPGGRGPSLAPVDPSICGSEPPRPEVTPRFGVSPDDLLARLRQADPPVIGRIESDRVVLDPRTVMPGEDEAVLRAVRGALPGAREA